MSLTFPRISITYYLHYTGRHCCVFCLINKPTMQVSVEDREPGVLRNLQQLDEHHNLLTNAGGDRRTAKDISFNVIDDRLTDIPLDQVSNFLVIDIP